MHDELKPYSEGEDNFTEGYGGTTARFVTSPMSGHGTFLPTPTSEFLDGYYNGGFSEGGNEHYNLEAQFTPDVLDIARGVRSYVMSVTGLPENFTTHDFGCAFGKLVYGFQQIGNKATGNEPNKEWVAAGNTYCKGALSHLPLEEALAEIPYEIDLFTALHVIEHLSDPLAALRTIKAKLSPTGVVYICVPNAHCIQYVLGGRRRDPLYSFPMHLQYFTAKSMFAYLREAGLEPFGLATRWLPDDLNGEDWVFQQLLGVNRNETADSAAWTQGICDNLLGGELFVLAGHSNNTTANRTPGLDEKAERAFDFVNRKRAATQRSRRAS